MPVPSSLAGLSAPVLDIVAGPVSDIVLAVTNIEGTETTVDEGSTRRIILASSVLFAESKARLTAAARKTLAETARQIIASKASGLVQINGYTDNQGSAAIGLVLSRRRAEAVRAVLAPALAGSGLRLATKGYGEAHPIATNTTKSGQAKNRRVEIGFTPAPR